MFRGYEGLSLVLSLVTLLLYYVEPYEAAQTTNYRAGSASRGEEGSNTAWVLQA
jgi:hypothetical protein